MNKQFRICLSPKRFSPVILVYFLLLHVFALFSATLNYYLRCKLYRVVSMLLQTAIIKRQWVNEQKKERKKSAENKAGAKSANKGNRAIAVK